MSHLNFRRRWFFIFFCSELFYWFLFKKKFRVYFVLKKRVNEFSQRWGKKCEKIYSQNISARWKRSRPMQNFFRRTPLCPTIDAITFPISVTNENQISLFKTNITFLAYIAICEQNILLNVVAGKSWYSAFK